jgi:benzoate membrane transport protein
LPNGSSPGFSHSEPINAGIVTSLVGFTSSFIVVFAGLRAVGASDRQATSGLLALSITMGIACIFLSLRYRMPITCAWSTPGAALLASTTAVDGGFNAAVGAFAIVGGLIVLTGFWPWLGQLIGRIPKSIAQAMLAGVLMPLCLAPVRAFDTVGWMAIPIALTWLLGTRFKPRWAVPGALFVTLLLIGWHVVDTGTSIAWSNLWPEPVWTTPDLGWTVLASIAIPLYIVTMASQNVPGVAVLATFGYVAPWRAALTTTGIGTVLGAPFGGHAINLAALSAALAAGPEAGADRSRRWVAAVTAGAMYIAFGLLSGLLVVLVAASPEGMLEVVAGLALLGTMASALTTSLSESDDRIACLVTFLVAASGVVFFGIGAAFWGLIGGLVVRRILWPDQEGTS